MAHASRPVCPVCGWNDEVVWVARVRRHGGVVAERWVCTGCEAMFGADDRSRRSRPWALVALAAVTAVPAVLWLQRPTASESR